MVISHNLQAINANRQLNIVSRAKNRSTERLASGYRINRSADDAAGLAMSEKMRRQIRGLTQASRNVQDGISFCQVADGALHEVSDMLQRINELAVKAANGTNTEDDRSYIDAEVQQLKKEIRRTSDTAEFNEIKIFKEDYVPEVSGQADDFQLFNKTNSTTFGGAIINGARYTWKELGIDLASDTYTDATGNLRFSADKTFIKDLASGERVELSGKKDAAIDSISRVYRWSADASGITINNNSSEKISWSSVRNADDNTAINMANIAPGNYHFIYHGMDIEFTVPESDSDIQDVISGINGSGATSRTYWHTEVMANTSSSAVELFSTSDGLKGNSSAITSSNVKAWTNANLRIVADSYGITLKGDDASISYTKTSWASILAAGNKTPSQPIVDWGMSDTNEQVTLGSAESYMYKDAVTGISFEFKLSDTASLDEVIKGLNDVYITREFGNNMNGNSNQNGNDTVTDGTDIVIFERANLTFPFQNLLVNDVEKIQNGYVWNPDFSVTQKGDNYVFELVYHGDAHDAKYECTVSKSELVKRFDNGSALNDYIKMSLANQSELNAYVSNTEYKYLNPVDKDLDIKIDMTNLKRIYSDEIAAGKTPTEAIDNTLNELVNFVNKTATAPSFKSTNITLDKITMTSKSNSSTQKIYGMVVSTPVKGISIQSGTEKDHYIQMEWSPISLGILGMGQANVLDRDNAIGTIGAVKYAMNVISNERSLFGAYQNRLEHTQKNLDNVVENTTASESAIRDTDMAKEMVQLSVHNILAQAGQTMLSQANQSNQGVLSLLQ